MADNIFQQVITPQKPRILSEERVFVYVPKATNDNPGIASYNARDFIVNNGRVSLGWPMELEITELTDPIEGLSRVKLDEDEFEHTNEETTVYNRILKQEYSTTKGSVKLNRKQRNAYNRPEFIKITQHDFTRKLDANDEYVYELNTSHSPFDEKTFIQIDRGDFYNNQNGIVKVKWPKANDTSTTTHTDGYGLVKIASDSAGYLRYSDSGLLEVDYNKIIQSEGVQIRPTYGGTVETGFKDIGQYVTALGKATKTAEGNIKLAITKDAVGLSKVANKAFSEYIYDDFGNEVKTHFSNEYNKKLDKITWNNLFSDWSSPSEELRTPHLWLDYLTDRDEAQQDQIDTLYKAKLFLGYFANENDLNAAYPPSQVWFGCYAFVYSTDTYWMIEGESEDTYRWKDTGFKILSYMDHIETDVSALKPDGVPSIGSTGKWIQSNHVHPTDETRLSKELYKSTYINVISEYLNDDNDFLVHLWNENAAGDYVNNPLLNIPYIRKSVKLHNWQGSNNIFTDSEESEERYWAGTKDQYNDEANNLGNSTIFFVDDGETTTVEEFITENELSIAGITIDFENQDERLVIVDYADADKVTKVPITIETSIVNGKNRFKVKPIDINPGMIDDQYIEGKLIGTKVVDNKVTIAPITFDVSKENNIMTTDQVGRLKPTSLKVESLLKTTNTDDTITYLTENRVLVAGARNSVTTFNAGTTRGRLIVSDGNGGIELNGSVATDRMMYSSASGTYNVEGYHKNNILITDDSVNQVNLGSGILVKRNSTRDNTVSTIDLGNVANKMVVTNGNSGITLVNVPAGKIVIGTSNGSVTTLSMSGTDAGKVVGVSTDGQATLLNVTHPNVLPITTYTSAPTNANSNGTILVNAGEIASSSLLEGYIYVW